MSVDPSDPIWLRLRQEAEAILAGEELLIPLVRSCITDRSSFEDALSTVLAGRLGEHSLPVVDLHRLFAPTLMRPEIAHASRRDLSAVIERDPATFHCVNPPNSRTDHGTVSPPCAPAPSQ